MNEDGPSHTYAAPLTTDADKAMVSPAHTGELLLATGAAGVGFTVIVVVSVDEVQPFTVTDTEYTPDMVVSAGILNGFCNELL